MAGVMGVGEFGTIGVFAGKPGEPPAQIGTASCVRPAPGTAMVDGSGRPAEAVVDMGGMKYRELAAGGLWRLRHPLEIVMSALMQDGRRIKMPDGRTYELITTEEGGRWLCTVAEKRSGDSEPEDVYIGYGLEFNHFIQLTEELTWDECSVIAADTSLRKMVKPRPSVNDTDKQAGGANGD